MESLNNIKYFNTMTKEEIQISLMEIVSTHGTGDQIRFLNELYKVEGIPFECAKKSHLTFDHTQVSTYKACGIDVIAFVDYMIKLGKDGGLGPKARLSEGIEYLITDEKLKAEAAVLFLLALQKMSPEVLMNLIRSV